uniref:Type II toxin-antitoxin system HicA family toxin n=1 Tax=Panagrellus redivivus TaxID=6233 RepID=A0A7E4VCU4_PANRE
MSSPIQSLPHVSQSIADQLQADGYTILTVRSKNSQRSFHPIQNRSSTLAGILHRRRRPGEAHLHRSSHA